MTGQREATPRPWVLGKAGDVGYSDSVAPCNIWKSAGPGNGMVATTAPWCQPYEQQRIDADLIVRAVNAHDSLVAALKKIADGYGPNHGSQYCRNIARAALLLAKRCTSQVERG